MPGRAVASYARVQAELHTSSHTVRCARLVQLCLKLINTQISKEVFSLKKRNKLLVLTGIFQWKAADVPEEPIAIFGVEEKAK
jgi:hypothetical protein